MSDAGWARMKRVLELYEGFMKSVEALDLQDSQEVSLALQYLDELHVLAMVALKNHPFAKVPA